MDGLAYSVVGGVVSGLFAAAVWEIAPDALGVVTLAVATATLLRHGRGDRRRDADEPSDRLGRRGR